MPTRSYLITAATALSLGYTAGFTADGLLAQTTVPGRAFEPTVTVHGIPETNPAVQRPRADVGGRTCGTAESDHGLDAGECTAANVRQVCLYYDRGENGDEVTAKVKFYWPATLTLGAPQ